MCNFLDKTNWYLYELGFFYILFFLIDKFISKRFWRTCTWIFTILVVGSLIFYLGVIPAWYRSIFCFPIGCILADYENEVLYYLKRKAVILPISLICILGMSSLFFGENHIVIGFILRNIMCMGGILLLCYVIQFWEWKNKLLSTISGASMYIYLFQWPFLKMITFFSKSVWEKLIFTLFTTVIVAIGMRWFKDKVCVNFKAVQFKK